MRLLFTKLFGINPYKLAACVRPDADPVEALKAFDEGNFNGGVYSFAFFNGRWWYRHYEIQRWYDLREELKFWYNCKIR